MKKQMVTASSLPKRKVIKASKSTADMLEAFESKLAEFGIESSIQAGCDTEPEGGWRDPEMTAIFGNERAVEIYEEDYTERYEDVGGGFAEPGSIITLADIKDYWNNNNMGDPSLEQYTSFNEWWADTRSNFLSEYYD
jgi:hypothetical protein